jgi:hypothetical protein
MGLTPFRNASRPTGYTCTFPANKPLLRSLWDIRLPHFGTDLYTREYAVLFRVWGLNCQALATHVIGCDEARRILMHREHKAIQLIGTTEEIFATTRKDAFVFVSFKA